MRRILTLGVAWAVAAIIAAVVAWQGVGLVGDQVTDDRPATLSAAEVEARLAGTAAPTGDGGTPTTSAPTTTTSAPPPTSVPSVTPVHRPYTVTGGTAVLSFSPESVTPVSAVPATGYTVRSTPHDSGGWRIEFEGPAGRSRIDAWWDGGPQDRVEDAAGTRTGDDDADDHGEVDD